MIYGDFWLYLEMLVGLFIVLGVIYFSKITLRKNKKVQEYIITNKWIHPNAISNWRKNYGPPITILYFIAVYFCFKPLIFICIEAFIFLAITDMLDGDIARVCNLKTEEGEALDAECDKWLDLPPLTIFSFLTDYYNFIIMIGVTISDIYGQLIRGQFSSAAAGKIGKLKTSIKFTLVYIFTFEDRYVEIHNYFNMEQIISVGLILILITAFVSMFLKTRFYNITLKRALN